MMNELVLTARVILAVVFLAAALFKLRDWGGWRASLTGLALLRRFASPVAFGLPLLELLVAVLLIVPATVWHGALAAVGLLASFSIFICATLMKGYVGDCRCFGNLSSARLTWGTVVRNLALLGLAIAIVAPGPAHEHAGLAAIAQKAVNGTSSIPIWLLLVLVAIQVFLQFQVIRQQGRILLRLDQLDGRGPVASKAVGAGVGSSSTSGLPVGALAPSFAGRDVSGAPKSLRSLQQFAKPILLVFLDPRCGPCRELLPEVRRWQRDHSHTLTVAVISRNGDERELREFRNTDLQLLVLQADQEISESYRSFGTPSAVALDIDGRIALPLVYGPNPIREMVQACARSTPIVARVADANQALAGASTIRPVIDSA